MVKNRSSEALAFGCVRNGGSECRFDHCARHCRDISPRARNALQSALQRSAWRSKEVAVSDFYAAKANTACADGGSSGQSVRRQLFDPRRLKINYETRDAPSACARLCLSVHQKKIGDGSIGDPSFFASNLPPTRNFDRERPDCRKVTAC